MKIIPYIRLIRPRHIIKNIAILLPSFFYKKITDCYLIYGLFVDFIAFSIAAWVVYVINDIYDYQNDRTHPIKKDRPLAKGEITIRSGWVFAGILSTLLIIFCLLFENCISTIIIVAYILINIFYSKFLKKIFILDSVVVSSAFVLRFVDGFFIARLRVNFYFLLMAYLIGMLVALSKNINLTEKRNGFLNKNNIVEYLYIIISPLIVILHYIFTSSLCSIEISIISTILIIAGLLRFQYCKYVKKDVKSPFDSLLSDIYMLMIAGIYLAILGFSLYLS